MNHHYELEKFALAGSNAQKAVDDIIAKHALPAATGPTPAGGTEAGAGGTEAARPRSPEQTATDELATISTSSDVAWLKSVMGNPDNQVTLRNAAQGRLRRLKRAKAQ